MKLLAVILFCVSCLAGPAQAQWHDAQTGQPLPDTEWRKSSGKLGAALLLTTEGPAFLKEWNESPESHIPSAKPVTNVKRGEVVSAFIVLTGCGEGATTCNATVEFKVLRPDGTPYTKPSTSPAWSGPPPKEGPVVLSDAYLLIRIEPQDPLGTYHILSVLKDSNTRVSISLAQQFEVVE